MRIQETDKILKESRYGRQSTSEQSHDTGMLSRVWQKVSGIFRKH
ncbi:MAG TPA: hypothetical protein VFN10_21500 [Thermoanaerobaculia bacterium]|nr:hypothetical protein [Thermoanaerobaculia bacterium]